MSSVQKVYIAGMGMITALGDSALTTAVAVRARRKGQQESAMLNEKYMHMKVAAVPDAALAPIEFPNTDAVCRQSRYRRMLMLSVVALSESVQATKDRSPLPLFLAGPDNRHAYMPPIDGAFLRYLAKASEINIDIPSSRLICSGRSGGIMAIELAFRYMEQTNRPLVVVGGVDSYLDLDLLGALQLDGRVSAIDKKDGFVPGEGAGFLLLASEQGLSLLHARPLGIVSLPAVAQEPGHRYSKEPYRGDGLAEAFRMALANHSGAPIRTVYSGMNGEHFGAKEFGVAMMRNGASIDENAGHEHPADCFGDIGASFGPVLVALSTLDMHKNYRPGPALIYCSSDAEHRAACCVSAIT